MVVYTSHGLATQKGRQRGNRPLTPHLHRANSVIAGNSR